MRSEYIDAQCMSQRLPPQSYHPCMPYLMPYFTRIPRWWLVQILRQQEKARACPLCRKLLPHKSQKKYPPNYALLEALFASGMLLPDILHHVLAFTLQRSTCVCLSIRKDVERNIAEVGHHGWHCEVQMFGQFM